MLSAFIEKKLHEASYEILEDGTYFGKIPSVPGVWADAATLESCRDELREVLESWIVLKLRDGDKIPGLDDSAQKEKQVYA